MKAAAAIHSAELCAKVGRQAHIPTASAGMSTDTATQLEQIAGDLHSVAFDFKEPARCRRIAEERIARVEDLADRLRATVRGRA